MASDWAALMEAGKALGVVGGAAAAAGAAAWGVLARVNRALAAMEMRGQGCAGSRADATGRRDGSGAEGAREDCARRFRDLGGAAEEARNRDEGRGERLARVEATLAAVDGRTVSIERKLDEVREEIGQTMRNHGDRISRLEGRAGRA